jgi:hypothetical protein
MSYLYCGLLGYDIVYTRRWLLSFLNEHAGSIFRIEVYHGRVIHHSTQTQILLSIHIIFAPNSKSPESKELHILALIVGYVTFRNALQLPSN